MTKEDKELLLKDLCMRLPYGVKVQVTQVPIGLSKDETLTYNRMYSLDESDEYITIKPYLRSMSSMTEEEKKELKCLFDAKKITNDSICFLEGGTLEEYEAQIPFSFCSKLIDWLNEHHFDYRYLIEKGLAIRVTEENNPYKNDI